MKSKPFGFRGVSLVFFQCNEHYSIVFLNLLMISNQFTDKSGFVQRRLALFYQQGFSCHRHTPLDTPLQI